MERSNIIMDSYPQWVKFIKALNKEAFWRYEASIACNNKTWRSKYIELRVRFFFWRDFWLDAFRGLGKLCVGGVEILIFFFLGVTGWSPISVRPILEIIFHF